MKAREEAEKRARERRDQRLRALEEAYLDMRASIRRDYEADLVVAQLAPEEI